MKKIKQGKGLEISFAFLCFCFVFHLNKGVSRRNKKWTRNEQKEKKNSSLLSFRFPLPLSFPPLSEVALLAALHADLGQRQADEEADVVCCFGF